MCNACGLRHSKRTKKKVVEEEPDIVQMPTAPEPSPPEQSYSQSMNLPMSMQPQTSYSQMDYKMSPLNPMSPMNHMSYETGPSEAVNNFHTSMSMGVPMGLGGMPGPSSQNRHPPPIQTNLPPTLTLDINNNHSMSSAVSMQYTMSAMSETPHSALHDHRL